MTLEQDLKKNWPKAKKQFEKFSKEALIVAEKGKKELVRFSKESKLRFDMTSLELKKEHLYYLIGKEFIKGNYPVPQDEKFKKMVQEVKKVNQEQKSLREELGGKGISA